jgi:hypothetical protein
MFCNCYDKINIYDRYNEKTCNQNYYLNSINSNSCNISSYNYKIDDIKLNKILDKIYHCKFIDFVKNSDYNSCEFNFNSYIREFYLLKPHKIKKENDHRCLYFNLSYKSKIWATLIPDNTSTQFTIKEIIDINKNDYAYITLLFPSYNKNGKKEYNYLLGCILVAYLLKTQPQSYDLHLQNKCGTKANIICMITPDVEEHIIKILELYYDQIIVVPYITWDNDINCSKILITDITKGNVKSEHPYSKVMTKLNIFNKKIFNYKKVVFIDSDLFPMGYYDSLFSLNTPAGCLEHRRYQENEFGIDSWALDRGQFFKHGHKISEMFTNLVNIYSSDINASLLVIEPDNLIYEEMINELKLPFEEIFSSLESTQTPYKGFWLGNKFYNFYYLPEQNYLTQKFSGKWHSIDMGFSSWLIDLEHCFGFTFAGFVVKPWLIQSEKHKYSINSYSLFSEINNKSTNRSYGCQIFNQYLSKMIYNSSCQEELIDYLKNIKITNYPFDTWEPELNLNNIDTILLEKYDFNNLSIDQKKLYYLITKNNKLKKIIYFDYLFENITKCIYNIDYIAISYHILNIIGNIVEKLNLSNKIYPFGNTLIGLYHYNSFDITDDDNDFIIILKKNKSKEKILDLIKYILDYNLQVYYSSGYSGKDTIFIQIISDYIKPSYYFNKNNNDCITYCEFKKNFDKLNFSFFNISLHKSQLDSIFKFLNINITNDMFMSSKHDIYLKSPWIDIFFLINEDNNLKFKLNDSFNPSYNIFTNDKKIIEINNYQINKVKYKKYIKEYYKNKDNYLYYKIKSKHSNYITEEKNILMKISKNNIIEKEVLLFIYHEINHCIKKIYNSFDLLDYLK